MKKPSPFERPVFVTKPRLPDLRDYMELLKDVWKSGWITNNGPQLRRLEDAIRRSLKVPHLTIMNNGTTALMLACKAIGLRNEVITTPFTCAATLHALLWAGIKPVFCDIDPDTMNIDPGKIEPLITGNTTGILPVHLFGVPCDVQRISKIARRHNLRVVYDAAHAFGVEIGGVGIGNFGDISMISFHATKIYHAAEGACLAYSSKRIKENLAILRNIGIKDEESIPLPGINAKMSELHAALGLAVLRGLNGEIRKREQLTRIYGKILKDIDGVGLVKDIEGVRQNYSYFVIRINERDFGKTRDLVCKRLREYNVFARKYFYPLCSDLPHLREVSGSSCMDLPAAKKISQEILCLPLHGGLSADDVEKICLILKSIRASV